MRRITVQTGFIGFFVALGCRSSAPERGPGSDQQTGATDADVGVVADSAAIADGQATPDALPRDVAADGGGAPDGPAATGDPDAPALDAGAPDLPAALDLATASPDSGGGDGAVSGGPTGPSTLCYREGSCGRGWGCVARDYSMFGHCLPLGAAGSYCRTSPGSTPCDAGLACVGEVVYRTFMYPSTITVVRSFCRPTAGDGASCVASECTAGTCPPSGSARCTADGASNGRCRDVSPRCDGTLGCASDGRCHPMGHFEGCGNAGETPFGCPDGKGCSTRNTACAPLGLSNSPCRPTAPRCDGTLACKGGVCTVGSRLGDRCSYLTDCEDGAGCVGSTCVAAPAGSLNGPCRLGDLCDAGLTCGPNQLCSDLFGTEGRSCGNASKCLPGLYCVTGTCHKRAALDQPCSGSEGQCIEGTACSFPSGRCATTGTLGKPCREVQIGSGDVTCDDGLACEVGSCRSSQPLPEVKLGQPCTADVNYCESGAVCSGGVCVAEGGFNAPCGAGPSGPCQQELGCSFDRKCVPGKHAGESCGSTLPSAPPCALPTICATRLDGTSVCTDVGYPETSIASPQWVDACGEGVRIALGPGRPFRDDGHPGTALLLPFAFKLWGSDRTQVWPSTNGFLAFGKTAPDERRGGEGLLPASGQDAIVAPFWDDLYLDDSPTSDLCFKTAGTAPSRRFVVEWQNAHRFGHPGVSLTFEIAIAEGTGAIDFLYQKLDAAGAGDRPYADGSRAAIGLQSPGAVRYVLHDRPLIAGQGFRFTPP